jgi:hypothetical protein
MQRHLPEPAPLARPRRLLAAMPSGLPTSSAWVLAAALIVTPVVTMQAVLPPDDHAVDPIPPQVHDRTTSGRPTPDPTAGPTCATPGGGCLVPRGKTGKHHEVPIDNGSDHPAAVGAPAPTAPAAATGAPPRDRIAPEGPEARRSNQASDSEHDTGARSGDREDAGDRAARDHDGGSDRESGDGGADRESGGGGSDPESGDDTGGR